MNLELNMNFEKRLAATSFLEIMLNCNGNGETNQTENDEKPTGKALTGACIILDLRHKNETIEHRFVPSSGPVVMCKFFAFNGIYFGGLSLTCPFSLLEGN